MRLMMVSNTGLALGLAMRCEGDGHDVRYATPTHSGKGLIPIHTPTESWRPDIVVFDSSDFLKEAEQCREAGAKVLGPTRWSAMLESDETYRKQIIESLGWRPATQTTGTHLHISGWFNGANFISSYSSLVYRRFMAGGVGPDLNCTGMIADFRGTSSLVDDKILRPLERLLKKVNHRGVVHVHALIDGAAFTVLEISTSLLHPLSLLLYENTFLSASDVLLRLLDETSKPVRAADKWAAGLCLSTPPYPHTADEKPQEINGIVQDNIKHLWLADVHKDAGKYQTCNKGFIGYVTARGPADPTNNVEHVECVRRLYRTVRNIKTPDLQYRNDIGKNVHSLFHALRQPGWLS